MHRGSFNATQTLQRQFGWQRLYLLERLFSSCNNLLTIHFACIFHTAQVQQGAKEALSSLCHTRAMLCVSDSKSTPVNHSSSIHPHPLRSKMRLLLPPNCIISSCEGMSNSFFRQQKEVSTDHRGVLPCQELGSDSAGVCGRFLYLF